MHLLIFLNLTNKFLEAFHINKIIYVKLFTIKTNFTGEFTKIIASVIFYDSCGEANLYSFCINNAQNGFLRYTKNYSRNFFKKTLV